MHPDEELLLRLEDGELPPDEAAGVRAHLARCPECAARSAALAREAAWVAGRLALVAVAIPPRPIEEVRSRVPRTRGPGWRVAAGILLALATAGAAYALPGSPVPDLLARLLGWGRSGSEAPGAGPQGVTPGGDGVAGIAVAPGARLVIAFRAAQARGTLTVMLHEAPEVVVRSTDSQVAFTTATGRLEVHNAEGAGSYTVEVPVAAPWVAVEIDGRRVFLKDGATLEPWGSEGRLELPLMAPAP